MLSTDNNALALDAESYSTMAPVAPQMPKTYSFLVKYGFLWRAAFNAWQVRRHHGNHKPPCWAHPCNLLAWTSYIAISWSSQHAAEQTNWPPQHPANANYQPPS